jgi:hypothetical protein
MEHTHVQHLIKYRLPMRVVNFWNRLVFASVRCVLYSLLGNKQPWTSHGIHSPRNWVNIQIHDVDKDSMKR